MKRIFFPVLLLLFSFKSLSNQDSQSSFFKTASVEELQSSFINAIKARDIESMEAHLKNGVDINIESKFFLAPLHFALFSDLDNNSVKLTEFLLKKGASVTKSTNSKGETILMILVVDSYGKTFNSDSLKLTKKLINIIINSEKESLNYRNSYRGHRFFQRSWMAIHYGAIGQPEVLKYLLEAGANPNEVTANGDTALHLASERKLPDNIKILLKHGADPDLKTEFGRKAEELLTGKDRSLIKQCKEAFNKKSKMKL